MKRLKILLLIAAVSLASFAFAQDDVGSAFVTGHLGTNEDLSIYMEFSETAIKPGSKFRVNIILKNMCDVPLRFLEPVLSKGEGLYIMREDGSQIRCQESEFAEVNPEKGIYYGRTFLLKPRKHRVMKWVAFLDRDYKLRFASERLLNKRSTPKKVKGIPKAFVGSGRVYDLKKPGIFTARMFYRVFDTGQKIVGPRGETYPKEGMWFGCRESENIKFLVK